MFKRTCIFKVTKSKGEAMKKFNVIVRALVACIALGNLPVDAMRNKNRAPRPVPAPFQKPATTRAGAEAAAKRLLAQDISSMDANAFAAWSAQLTTYIAQIGVDTPAGNYLAKQAQLKLRNKQIQIASEDATQEVIAESGSSIIGGLQGDISIGGQSTSIGGTESTQEGAFDVVYGGGGNAQVDVKGSDLKPIDVRPNQPLLSADQLAELIQKLEESGRAVAKKERGQANKLAKEIAQSLTSERVQQQFAKALENLAEQLSNEQYAASVEQAAQSQNAWQQKIGTYPDIFLPQSMIKETFDYAKAIKDGMIQLRDVIGAKYGSTLEKLGEQFSTDALLFALDTISTPASQLSASLERQLTVMTALQRKSLDVINALNNTMTNNGQEPSIYFGTSFLLQKLETKGTSTKEYYAAVKLYLDNIKQISTVASRLSDKTLANLLVGAKSQLATMMQRAYSYASIGTKALKIVAKNDDSAEAGIVYPHTLIDPQQITFANLVTMFKELNLTLLELFPDLSSQLPTKAQMDQLVADINEARALAEKTMGIAKQ